MVNSRSDEWIGSPGAPKHGEEHNHHSCYEMSSEQANQSSYLKRKQAVPHQAKALEEDYFPSLFVIHTNALQVIYYIAGKWGGGGGFGQTQCFKNRIGD